jgi:hypothetical protein
MFAVCCNAILQLPLHAARLSGVSNMCGTVLQREVLLGVLHFCRSNPDDLLHLCIAWIATWGVFSSAKRCKKVL